MDPSVDNSLDSHEVIRRFPEINKIDYDSIRQNTINAFVELCPDYFWNVPASSSGNYHPKDHRGDRGLWLHTKRAFTQYQRLAPSFHHQNKITKKEMDYGKSAILLHDMFKYGWPKQDHTTKDHDVIAAKILDDYLAGDVIGCIATHNGPWYEGPSPRSDLEQVHHMADMAASDVSNPNIAVLNPSRELKKEFPNVNKKNK